MQQPPSQQPSEGLSAAADELRSDAQQIGSTAASRLQSEVDARKSGAASQAKSVSSAIQRAAGELDDGAPAWLKSAFQQGADQIQRFADTLEQKDSRQILNEVQNFARERPGTFLAACAAAGFAAARIFKSGAEGAQSGQGQQWDRSVPVDPGAGFQGQGSPQGGDLMFQSPGAGTSGSRTASTGEFA
ncbi:MAG TPA: hypothetical protein VM265_00310 [Sphingomicrobium sp.]|nr:hypothetical protein [Sphingomicrobium sp.]